MAIKTYLAINGNFFLKLSAFTIYNLQDTIIIIIILFLFLLNSFIYSPIYSFITFNLIKSIYHPRTSHLSLLYILLLIFLSLHRLDYRHMAFFGTHYFGTSNNTGNPNNH
eukprot:390641_1